MIKVTMLIQNIRDIWTNISSQLTCTIWVLHRSPAKLTHSLIFIPERKFFPWLCSKLRNQGLWERWLCKVMAITKREINISGNVSHNLVETRHPVAVPSAVVQESGNHWAWHISVQSCLWPFVRSPPRSRVKGLS